MSTLSRTFSLHHPRGHHNATRSIWRDMGVGLAIGLTVLILAVVGIRGSAGMQQYASSLGTEEPQYLSGWEYTGLPDRTPIDPLTIGGAM